MAFNGADLRPLRDELISKVAGGTADAGDGLDLSLITQLLGDKQRAGDPGRVLAFHRLFRSPCAAAAAAARARARRRRSTWAATRRSNSCSRNPRSNCRCSISSPGRAAGAAAGTRRGDRDRVRFGRVP